MDLLDFLYETKSDAEIINFLKEVSSINNLETVLKTYSSFTNPLTTTIPFESNEEMVINRLKSNTKNKIENIKKMEDKKIEDKK
jgi:hypothetical protein